MVWPVHCRGTVGVVKNPNGRPSSLFQGFSDRSALLLEKYGRSEILAIADDDKRLDEFSSFDCLIIRQLASALRANHDSSSVLMEERERLYDRTMGKAVSRTELTGKDGADLQINVVTGVSAVDADFQVVAPAVLPSAGDVLAVDSVADASPSASPSASPVVSPSMSPSVQLDKRELRSKAIRDATRERAAARKLRAEIEAEHAAKRKKRSDKELARYYANKAKKALKNATAASDDVI